MKVYAIGIGAVLLAMLGAGCVTQPGATSVSAMIRTAPARPDVSRLGVAVNLREIVTP